MDDMASDEYTPTMEDLRQAWVEDGGYHLHFDLALAQRDREVKVAALREGARLLLNFQGSNRFSRILQEEAYRIEGGGGDD